jgi:hypothetical protein
MKQRNKICKTLCNYSAKIYIKIAFNFLFTAFYLTTTGYKSLTTDTQNLHLHNLTYMLYSQDL